MPRRFTVTTSIPYVNARPHLGFALEAVQADVLARRRRALGAAVRFQTGTDDNALKNAQAAEREGVAAQELVDRNAALFLALRELLHLSTDDFVRTSRDPRHAAGVTRLWRACAARGDLYRRRYEGLYCVGCELFYHPRELDDGRCPEHGTQPERVAEENWFFRLSRYAGRLSELLASGKLAIVPEQRRNEVLAFVAAGLDDFSVSRSRERARGWGIPVPDDPSQVVYVWFDALANYVTGPGYGTDDEAYARWWAGADERVHVIGKDIVRFHAVYWPALLLSAGEPLPTAVLVHDFVTAAGRKLSKSAGTSVEPAELVARFGADAVRWWLLRDVPRVGDVDFTVEKLVARHDADLANGLGNLVRRTAGLVARYRDGIVPRCDGRPASARALAAGRATLAARIDAALAEFDFRGALAELLGVVAEANRFIESERPWEVARAEREGDSGAAARLDAVLATLAETCRELAHELAPFLPDASERISQVFAGARVDESAVVFPRLG